MDFHFGRRQPTVFIHVPKNPCIINLLYNMKTIFECPDCDYNSQRSNNLKTHINSIHRGETFQCTECDYKAKWKSHLYTHIKSIHRGIKNQCPECDYKTAYNKDLQTHIRSIHEGEELSCLVCEYKSKLEKNLQRHIDSMHRRVTSVCCNFCNRIFNSKDAYNYHQKSKHL